MTIKKDAVAPKGKLKKNNSTTFKKGNQAAADWTEEEAAEVLIAVAEDLKTGAYSLRQEAFLDKGISRGLVHYWRTERFKDSKSVQDAIKKLKWFAEDRTVVAISQNAIPTNFGIFIMKANFNWVEKGVEMQADALRKFEGFEFVPVESKAE